MAFLGGRRPVVENVAQMRAATGTIDLRAGHPVTPVDPAGDETTVGGAVATNDTGPLRHRYGTPRDLLIGVRLATTDGRLVKAGGNVVKNVAGYDLGKLVSGSFGSGECFAAMSSMNTRACSMERE